MFEYDDYDGKEEVIAAHLKYEGGTLIKMFFETTSFTANPNSKEGEIGGDVHNGDFTFSWSPEYYTFSMSHFGSGDSGSLKVKVPVTEGSKESLASCLQIWKDKVKDEISELKYGEKTDSNDSIYCPKCGREPGNPKYHRC